MKSLKQLSLVVLLSVFVFGANNTFAQDCNKKHQHGIENAIPDLTEDQKTDIKKLRTEHRKEVQQIKNQMDIKRAELKALQTAENPDIAAINKKIEERSALRTDLEKKSAAHKQDVRKLLNDEQKVVYDNKMNRKAHHKCGGHNAAHKCGGDKAAHKCGGQKAGHKCGGHGEKAAPCKK